MIIVEHLVIDYKIQSVNIKKQILKLLEFVFLYICYLYNFIDLVFNIIYLINKLDKRIIYSILFIYFLKIILLNNI